MKKLNLLKIASAALLATAAMAAQAAGPDWSLIITGPGIVVPPAPVQVAPVRVAPIVVAPPVAMPPPAFGVLELLGHAAHCQRHLLHGQQVAVQTLADIEPLLLALVRRERGVVLRGWRVVRLPFPPGRFRPLSA